MNVSRSPSLNTLESIYGGPSQAGFGSAVFEARLTDADDLIDAALATYRRFVGPLWERFGERAWMSAWRETYIRPTSGKADIVTELRGISDRSVRASVPMILDSIEAPDAAHCALRASFDDPGVSELRVFNLGDGGALSGLLVAARRGGNGLFLAFLMD